jgi:hypothetical protein
MKFGFSRQSFEEKLKYQILSKYVHWEQIYSMRTDGDADGHDEADSRFSQLNAPKNGSLYQALCVQITDI